MRSSVLCCAMLCCAVLCCAVPCRAVIFCNMLPLKLTNGLNSIFLTMHFLPHSLIHIPYTFPFLYPNHSFPLITSSDTPDPHLLCEDEMTWRLQRGHYHDPEALAVVFKPSVQGTSRCSRLPALPHSLPPFVPYALLPPS